MLKYDDCSSIIQNWTETYDYALMGQVKWHNLAWKFFPATQLPTSVTSSDSDLKYTHELMALFDEVTADANL